LNEEAALRLWAQGNGWKRRIALVAVRLGEGRLNEPTAAVQPWPRVGRAIF
jgi:hypothetical protein